MATVCERLKELIVEQLDVDVELVTPEASFVEDFNADSLDLVEFITAVEEEFSSQGKKLEISDEDFEKLQTVQDVVDYLYDRGTVDE